MLKREGLHSKEHSGWQPELYAFPGFARAPGLGFAALGTGPPILTLLHHPQRLALRGMVCWGQREDSLVKVMLKPLFPVEWSVWNSRRATWPLLVMEEGSWFPEKVPRTGASAVAPSLMTRKSN